MKKYTWKQTALRGPLDEVRYCQRYTQPGECVYLLLRQFLCMDDLDIDFPLGSDALISNIIIPRSMIPVSTSSPTAVKVMLLYSNATRLYIAAVGYFHPAIHTAHNVQVKGLSTAPPVVAEQIPIPEAIIDCETLKTLLQVEGVPPHLTTSQYIERTMPYLYCFAELKNGGQVPKLPFTIEPETDAQVVLFMLTVFTSRPKWAQMLRTGFGLLYTHCMERDVTFMPRLKTLHPATYGSCVNMESIIEKLNDEFAKIEEASTENYKQKELSMFAKELPEYTISRVMEWDGELMAKLAAMTFQSNST